MDRFFVVKLLQEAKARVAQGEEHIREQRELIAELERDGHDTFVARELLATFEQIQVLHIAGRDRLVKELKEQNTGGASPVED